MFEKFSVGYSKLVIDLVWCPLSDSFGIYTIALQFFFNVIFSRKNLLASRLNLNKIQILITRYEFLLHSDVDTVTNDKSNLYKIIHVGPNTRR